jgi:hypothetical protein
MNSGGDVMANMTSELAVVKSVEISAGHIVALDAEPDLSAP